MKRVPLLESGGSPRPEPAPSPGSRVWPAWAQAAASLVLALHMAAILAAAAATNPSSDLQRRAALLFRGYYEIINQGYGYRYYARLDTTTDPHNPRPWATPIITAEMEFERAGGGPTTEILRLPGRDRPWPRLRYQRQLDLAYHLTADPRWAASFARHLCKTRGCAKVTLYAQDHRIPDLARVRAAAVDPSAPPVDLEAESTYGPRRNLGEFQCADF